MIMGFEVAWWIYLPGSYTRQYALSIVTLTARARAACMNFLNDSYYSWQVLTRFPRGPSECIHVCTSIYIAWNSALHNCCQKHVKAYVAWHLLVANMEKKGLTEKDNAQPVLISKHVSCWVKWGSNTCWWRISSVSMLVAEWNEAVTLADDAFVFQLVFRSVGCHALPLFGKLKY